MKVSHAARNFVTATCICVGALLGMTFSANAAFVEIQQGQRKTVAVVVSPPFVTREICLNFNDTLTGAPALVHLWREAEPGGGKDLAEALGRRCLKSKGLRYIVKVMAVNSNVTVRVADEFALVD